MPFADIDDNQETIINDDRWKYNHWKTIINNYYSQKSQEDWIAIDGKSLKNTLTDYEEKSQNMLNVVSWFSQETKLIIKVEIQENKKKSEIAVVLSMIENCDLSNKRINATKLC
jgi:hypothetical protein